MALKSVEIQNNSHFLQSPLCNASLLSYICIKFRFVSKDSVINR